MNILRTLAALFLLAAPLTLHAGDQTDGSIVTLQAVPRFVNRVFVPVVPGAVNTFRIASSEITDVVDAPAGYSVLKHDRGVVIYANAGEGFGYTKVRVDGRELTLTLINLVPYEEVRDGRLDGYQIGEYKEAPLKGLQTYRRPRGFIRLSRANADVFVSDHYRLRDFQCKLDGETKVLILRTEALLKLELLQHTLNADHGLNFDRFTIMSGYRTPYYNARIGNETGYSRHLYGDAMDIYIDQDRNGTMDDVNHDGRVDSHDARFLLTVAASIDESPQWNWLKGGAGVYHANAAHGPYIHVDARGYIARWGV